MASSWGRETSSRWLADEQDQQRPTDAERLDARGLKHVEQHGGQSFNEMVIDFRWQCRTLLVGWLSPV